MALNSSGPISLVGCCAGVSIRKELGLSGALGMTCASVRGLAGVASGAITMPGCFYGKSNVPGNYYAAQIACRSTGYSCTPTIMSAALDPNGNLWQFGYTTTGASGTGHLCGAFLRQIGPTGSILAYKKLTDVDGSQGNAMGGSLNIDSSGNFYIGIRTGAATTYNGTVTSGSPTPSYTNPSSQGGGITFAKFNACLVSQWQTFATDYSNSQTQSGWASLMSTIDSSGNSYWIYLSRVWNSNHYFAVVNKINSSGTIQYGKHLNQAVSSSYACGATGGYYPAAAIVDSSGNLAIFGNATSGSSNRHGAFVKINSSGSVITSKGYGCSPFYFLNSLPAFGPIPNSNVVINSSGQYVIPFYKCSSSWIGTFASCGAFVSANKYACQNYTGGITKDSCGNIYTANYGSSTFSKFDSSLNHLFTTNMSGGCLFGSTTPYHINVDSTSVYISPVTGVPGASLINARYTFRLPKNAQQVGLYRAGSTGIAGIQLSPVTGSATSSTSLVNSNSVCTTFSATSIGSGVGGSSPPVNLPPTGNSIISFANTTYTASNTNLSGYTGGSTLFTNTGSSTWIAPSCVTSVSVLAIGYGGFGVGSPGGSLGTNLSGGGGGLGYKNNISVTPGTSYNVYVGYQTSYSPTSTTANSFFISTSTVSAQGGSSNVRFGGTFVGDGGGSGGNGGNCGGGGGGAGGYSGNGGSSSAGGPINRGSCNLGFKGGTGAGGGGGAGGVAVVDGIGGGGGGVGLWGAGLSGTGGSPVNRCNTTGGSGGSCGCSGGSGYLVSGCAYCGYNNGYYYYSYTHGGSGGRFGGGGGAPGGTGYTCPSQPQGGQGLLRIIWPGTTRQYPSTNVVSP